MKKDVIISIKGTSTTDGDKDTIELLTEGNFYRKNDAYYIIYEESEATGFEGCKTTLKVENNNKVTMQRSGTSKSHLIIENNKRHICQYDTQFGDILVGIFAQKIQSDLTDKGGNLHFKYSLDINSRLASENEVFVTIRETN